MIRTNAGRQKILVALLLLIGFLSGVLVTGAFSYLDYAQSDNDWESNSDTPGGVITGMVAGVAGVPERASPADRIPQKDIAVFSDRVVIGVQNPQWSTFTDTNSMDPVIDEGANAIQVVPGSVDEVEVGDIISYESEFADGIFIHRVVFKGIDELGTYFIAKGDNLPTSDPGRIRFEQIKRVVVAIIY
ncbi:hypothetical protein GOV10_03380 [Candidatus Woesearchaeota archaeon]|nr:hypothetical protein [Candidatus Woesearchaeota archaeon]